MARNRIIKPEFWADEKLGGCSFAAQLLYIGSWNFGDDWGVCRANTLYLRNNIFPYSSITIKQIESALKELADKSRIYLGDYNGESYFFIPKFLEHQKIDRPSKFRHIPEELEYTEIFKHSSSNANTLDTHSTMNVNVNENVNVNVNVKEKVNVYGEHKNVKLSDIEFKKLSDIYKEKLDKGLEILSSYLKAKGDGYKNHYAVMGEHNWVYERTFKNHSNPIKGGNSGSGKQYNQCKPNIISEREPIISKKYDLCEK